MKNYIKLLLRETGRIIAFFLFPFFLAPFPAKTQPLPSPSQNIDWLFTSAKRASEELGDDDHIQHLFFLVPEEYEGEFYLWIEDPACNQINDHLAGEADSHFSFEIFGGMDVYKPCGYDYCEGGIRLADTVFSSGEQDKYIFSGIESWKGQYIKELNGNLFRIVIKGLEGDDGNNYRLFFSSSPKIRKEIKNARIIYNQLSFKLIPSAEGKPSILNISIPPDAVGISLMNFDLDDRGEINIISNVRQGQKVRVSENDRYRFTLLKVYSQERNSGLRIEIRPGKNAFSEELYTSFGWIIEDREGRDISFPFPYQEADPATIRWW